MLRRSAARNDVFFFSALALLFFLAPLAHSQAPTLYIPVALAPVSRETPIELVALTVDAEIRDVNGHTFISGNSTFKLHNTDRLTDLQIPIGFPAWASDPYAFDPARLESFVVTLDNKKINLTLTQAELKIGKEIRAVNWYTFTLSIAGDEKRTVRVDFEQDLGDVALPRFTYGLVTGTGWKGAIGSARLTLQFSETTTQEQIIAYDPPDPNFDGSRITWLFQNYEPPANPFLQIIRPTLWSDLVARRRAVQQNPNDANARAALGASLRALALNDTPRRDSFFAQAVAENETALRLDPNQRAARQSLAQLYELRAGAATGPRNAAYVALAVEQWEKINDANARRQLAEDYFYLGLDAHTRGAFSDAQNFYDKAQTLAPNGAGPLYLPDRLLAQRRALNLVWARALLEQNEITLATQKARAALGENFSAQFKPPPFIVTRANVETMSGSRAITFSLAPYADNAKELQNELSGIVAAWRAAGADANFSSDASEVTLTINVAFKDQNDLREQLAALAQSLENRDEWSLARAVIAPAELTWRDTEEFWARTLVDRESVDLSDACNAFSARAQIPAQVLATLPNAQDEESQLTRALLEYAQRGWQSALAQGRVSYRVGAQEIAVDACAAREIALNNSAWRIERVIAAVIGLEFFGGMILLWRWLRGVK